MENPPGAIYEAVRAGDLARARDNPARFRLIEAVESVETIARKILEHLAPFLQSR